MLGVARRVVAIVLLIVLKGNDSATAAKTDGGKLHDDRRRTRTANRSAGSAAHLQQGRTVRFKVDSDVADEVHFHGYDVMKDVKAGGSVTFDFPATIEGVFEAELEGRKEQILELTVNP